MKKLTVIILNYNTPDMTRQAIEKLLVSARGVDFDLIVIDNGSAEKMSHDFLSSIQCQYIKNGENVGFAKAVNQGLCLAQGEFVLLLNSDALLRDDSLNLMLYYMTTHQRVAVVGPKITYPNGYLQASFGFAPTLRRVFFKMIQIGKILPLGMLVPENILTRKYFKQASRVDWVSGACMLIRRNVFDRVDLFDEKYFFGFEDIDFCYRVSQVAQEVIYLPSAEVVHHHGFSSGGKRSLFSIESEMKGVNYFYEKHWPKRKVSQGVIRILYQIKLFYNKFLFRPRVILANAGIQESIR